MRCVSAVISFGVMMTASGNGVPKSGSLLVGSRSGLSADGMPKPCASSELAPSVTKLPGASWPTPGAASIWPTSVIGCPVGPRTGVRVAGLMRTVGTVLKNGTAAGFVGSVPTTTPAPLAVSLSSSVLYAEVNVATDVRPAVVPLVAEPRKSLPPIHTRTNVGFSDNTESTSVTGPRRMNCASDSTPRVGFATAPVTVNVSATFAPGMLTLLNARPKVVFSGAPTPGAFAMTGGYVLISISVSSGPRPGYLTIGCAKQLSVAEEPTVQSGIP